MRVFVTGATGFIGRALIPRLQRDGHALIAWVRSPDRARGLLGAEVELVHADSEPDGLEGLKAPLAARGLDVPIYLGMRNWHPLLPDTLKTMAKDGVRRDRLRLRGASISLDRGSD